MNSDDIAVGILKAATVIAIVAGITWLFYSERPWLAVLLGAAALVWPALWSQLHDYQRERILTFIDPTAPAGQAFYRVRVDP